MAVSLALVTGEEIIKSIFSFFKFSALVLVSLTPFSVRWLTRYSSEVFIFPSKLFSDSP